MRSFEAVTGPKTDHWLVRTVGLLAAAASIPILRAAARDRVDDQTAALAISSAVAFVAGDLPPVASRRISPIYLADAAIEALFVGLWARGRPPGREGRRSGAVKSRGHA
jgi:hypothetical protein